MGNQQSQTAMVGKLQARKERFLNKGGEKRKSEASATNGAAAGAGLPSSRVTATGGKCTLLQR
jgi:hypothetical protein